MARFYSGVAVVYTCGVLKQMLRDLSNALMLFV